MTSALSKRLINDGLKGAAPSRTLSELLSEHRGMLAALHEWKCPSCGGATTYKARSKAGAAVVPCKVCGGSGLHPTARDVISQVTAGHAS